METREEAPKGIEAMRAEIRKAVSHARVNLDDFSRYIIAWKLSPTMGASDVTETLDQALAITGVDQVRVKR